MITDWFDLRNLKWSICNELNRFEADTSLKARLIRQLCPFFGSVDDKSLLLDVKKSLVEEFARSKPDYRITLDTLESSAPLTYSFRQDASLEDRTLFFMEKLRIFIHLAPELLESHLRHTLEYLPEMGQDEDARMAQSSWMLDFENMFDILSNLELSSRDTGHVDGFVRIPYTVFVEKLRKIKTVVSTLKKVTDTLRDPIKHVVGKRTSDRTRWSYYPRRKDGFKDGKPIPGTSSDKDNLEIPLYHEMSLQLSYAKVMVRMMEEILERLQERGKKEKAPIAEREPRDDHIRILKRPLASGLRQIARLIRGLISFIISQGLNPQWDRFLSQGDLGYEIKSLFLAEYEDDAAVSQVLTKPIINAVALVAPVGTKSFRVMLDTSFPSCRRSLKEAHLNRDRYDYPRSYEQTRMTGYLMALVRIYGKDLTRAPSSMPSIIWGSRSIQWLTMIKREVQEYSDAGFLSWIEKQRKVVRSIDQLLVQLFDMHEYQYPSNAVFNGKKVTPNRHFTKEEHLEAIMASRRQLTHDIKSYLLECPIQPLYWEDCVNKEIRV